MSRLRTMVLSTGSVHEIRDLLIDFGIEVQHSEYFGSLLDKSVLSAINDCDFVTAVITKDDSTVFYELGYAHGLQKPVFLISNHQQSALSYLPGIVYVRYEANLEGIRFSLEQFIKNLSKKKKTTTGQLGHKKKPQVDFYRIYTELEMLRGESAGRSNVGSFEGIFHDLFLRLQLGAVVRNKATEIGDIDFALWVDEVQNGLGNPIVVELKIGALSEQKLRTAESVLQRNIEQTNAQTGILVYLDCDGRRFPSTANNIYSNIYRLEATDLVMKLSDETLGDILLKCRNEALHKKGDN